MNDASSTPLAIRASDPPRPSGRAGQAYGRSVLDGHVAGVSLLAADDLHHVRQQQWVALLVEFKRPTHAFEADAGERIPDGGAIFLPCLLDGQQRKRIAS